MRKWLRLACVYALVFAALNGFGFALSWLYLHG